MRKFLFFIFIFIYPYATSANVTDISIEKLDEFYYNQFEKNQHDFGALLDSIGTDQFVNKNHLGTFYYFLAIYRLENNRLRSDDRVIEYLNIGYELIDDEAFMKYKIMSCLHLGEILCQKEKYTLDEGLNIMVKGMALCDQYRDGSAR